MSVPAFPTSTGSGGLEPAQADAVHNQLGLAGPLDLDAERPDGLDRRERVGRGAEPPDVHRSRRDRPDQHRPVADRLVARHGELAGEPSGRSDAEPLVAHASTAGVATAP
jgi:hypothetical protein